MMGEMEGNISRERERSIGQMLLVEEDEDWELTSRFRCDPWQQ